MGAEELLQWNETGRVSQENRGILDAIGLSRAFPKETENKETIKNMHSILIVCFNC